MSHIEMRLEEWPLRALEATLDLAVASDAPFESVPALWHWLYFLKNPPRSALGADGHPAEAARVAGTYGERRLFAGARTEFHRPLCIGATAQLTETALATRRTAGKSGPLRIETFEYRYSQAGALCIREERDIAYVPAIAGAAAARDGSAAPRAAPTAAPTAATTAATTAAPLGDYAQDVTPDAAMLFRFSALTFNAHRIHYDQHYAQVQEGHPERVVHGPLTAILLAELLRARGTNIRRFEFRACRPLFVDAAIHLTAMAAGDRIALRALDPDGMTAMVAEAFR